MRSVTRFARCTSGCSLSNRFHFSKTHVFERVEITSRLPNLEQKIWQIRFLVMSDDLTKLLADAWAQANEILSEIQKRQSQTI